MKKIYSLFFLILTSIFSYGQISITSTGSAFTQNFDGMGSTAAAPLPTGFKIGLDWAIGTTATTLAAGTSGTGALTGTSSGGVYNFGNGITASATDRSLGFLTSSGFSSPRSIVLKITNNTGGTITDLAIAFDYEKYRAGTRAFDWTFFHGNTSTPSTGEVLGNQSYAADAANAVVNPPTTISKSVTLTGLSIAAGTDYYLKWTNTGVGGSTNSQGIGIDNFSITATGTGGADIIAPTVTTLTPADNSTNVSTSTNLQILFNEPIAKGTGNIIIKRVSDNVAVQTIDVTTAAVTVAGSNATITINALLNNTDYYIEIAAGAFTDIALNNFAGISGATSWNFTTVPVPAAGIVGNNYSFTNCTSTFINEGWNQYSVTGAQTWACTTTGRTDAFAVQMNAFVAANNNPLNEDWLISPAFDLTGVSLPTLKFYSRGEFTSHSLQLKISSNYTVGTNPNTATWTNLNGNFPPNVAQNGPWSLSDNIDLSAYNIINIRLAWVYINPTTTNSSRWSIDDVSVNSNIPCPEPSAQPTNLNLSATVSTVTGTFTPVTTPTSILNYFVVRSLTNTLTQFPVDGTTYTNGQVIGGGNGTVVAISNNGSFTDNTVSASTQYYYFVFSMEDQGCIGGPNYNIANPLTLGVITATPPACTTPVAPTTPFTLTPSNTSINGSFTGSGASKYLVIRSTATPPLGASPTNGTVYTAGQVIGNGTVVTYTALTTFTASGLTAATPYNFYVFAANDVCIGEPFYSTLSLDGTATTTNTSTGVPPGYYNAAAGLSCAPLKTALNSIITTGHTQNNYGDLDNIQMLTTDDRLNDAGTATIVWDMYSENPSGPDPYTYTFSQFNIGTGTDGEGNGWNKEHSFPNSWFGGGTSNLPGADLFHIYPTDMDVNSLRSNFPYGKVATATTTTLNGSKLGSSAVTFTGYSGPVFEPIDSFKGDLARATLYMVTRYQAEQPSWESLQAGGDVVMDGSTYPSVEIDYLKMLIQWNALDPVSFKEIQRNNEVYAIQGNRNPFIDHPEYIGQIWSTGCGLALPVTLKDLKVKYSNNQSILNWEVENAQGFSHFMIERSVDGVSFTSIGRVNYLNSSTYSFNDILLPKASVIYYRLKMVDVDGKFKNSHIVFVKLNGLSNALVFPNPTKEYLSVRLYEDLYTNSTLQILDVAGRIVKQQQVAAHSFNINLLVKDLAVGRYFITIKNNKQHIQESFVVTN